MTGAYWVSIFGEPPEWHETQTAAETRATDLTARSIRAVAWFDAGFTDSEIETARKDIRARLIAGVPWLRGIA